MLSNNLLTTRIFKTTISTYRFFASSNNSNRISTNWARLLLLDIVRVLHVSINHNMEIYEKATKYFSKHPMYNAIIHLSGGIAVGILIARPFDSGHPLQLALIFGAIALIGHIIPLLMGKMK